MSKQTKKLIEDTLCYVGIFGIVGVYMYHLLNDFIVKSGLR